LLKHSSKCDPALLKAIVLGRAWFEELATGRARSLQELAKRDGISRRYRRLVGLAFLSPQLVEAILQGGREIGEAFEDCGTVPRSRPRTGSSHCSPGTAS
jgi:hypothetical protein